MARPRRRRVDPFPAIVGGIAMLSAFAIIAAVIAWR